MSTRTSDPGTLHELPADVVRLLSVNVGRPRVLGRVTTGRNGGGRVVTVMSGIAKQPVSVVGTAGLETLYLDWENLEGDAQADRRVHGGPDKAVYGYPALPCSGPTSPRMRPPSVAP